jgi:hypothetical protein
MLDVLLRFVANGDLLSNVGGILTPRFQIMRVQARIYIILYVIRTPTIRKYSR